MVKFRQIWSHCPRISVPMFLAAFWFSFFLHACRRRHHHRLPDDWHDDAPDQSETHVRLRRSLTEPQNDSHHPALKRSGHWYRLRRGGWGYGEKSWLLKQKALSSGYGRRLMFQRSWVRIPALYTGWAFFHITIRCKNCNVCWIRRN